MQPATQNGIESLLSRKTLFVVGLAAWAGGAVLAGAAGYRAHHHARLQSSSSDGPGIVEVDPARDEPSPPSTVEVMPQDTVVAPRQAGTAEMQRP